MYCNKHETYLKCPVWYATIALARKTASEFSNSLIFGCATGKLHRNLANRSISPDSSNVSQTVATCVAEKFSVGKANNGLGAKIGWADVGELVPPVGPTAIDGRTTARLKLFGAILRFLAWFYHKKKIIFGSKFSFLFFLIFLFVYLIPYQHLIQNNTNCQSKHFCFFIHFLSSFPFFCKNYYKKLHNLFGPIKFHLTLEINWKFCSQFVELFY